MVSVRIYATRNLVITCQKKNLASVQNLATEMEQGRPPLSTGDFLVRLNEQLVLNMSSLMEDIEDKAMAIEEQVMENELDDCRTDLYQLRRQIIQLKRFLIPQRDALNKLLLDKTPWTTTKQQNRLREVNDYLMRYLEMLDASRELAAITMETINQRQNEQLNKRMYLLSLITALFLPLSFFTGLFGVNLSGIPFSGSEHAFILFTGILCLLIALMIWVFRKNKWI